MRSVCLQSLSHDAENDLSHPCRIRFHEAYHRRRLRKWCPRSGDTNEARRTKVIFRRKQHYTQYLSSDSVEQGEIVSEVVSSRDINPRCFARCEDDRLGAILDKAALAHELQSDFIKPSDRHKGVHRKTFV